MEVVLPRSSITRTATGVSATAERTESVARSSREPSKRTRRRPSPTSCMTCSIETPRGRWVEARCSLIFHSRCEVPAAQVRPVGRRRKGAPRMSQHVHHHLPGQARHFRRVGTALRGTVECGHDQVTEFRSLMNLSLHRIPRSARPRDPSSVRPDASTIRKFKLTSSIKSTYARGMEWLNYHHLLYFWVVAKEGSIVRASKELRLAHPTISGQIHRLEENLGEKLFARRGRHLVLTEVGRVPVRYADEIFSLGRELIDTLKGRASGKPLRLTVGVADVLPPSLVRRFLGPAFRLGHPLQIPSRAHKWVGEFIARIALHLGGLGIARGPARPGSPIR